MIGVLTILVLLMQAWLLIYIGYLLEKSNRDMQRRADELRKVAEKIKEEQERALNFQYETWREYKERY